MWAQKSQGGLRGATSNDRHGPRAVAGGPCASRLGPHPTKWPSSSGSAPWLGSCRPTSHPNTTTARWGGPTPPPRVPPRVSITSGTQSDNRPMLGQIGPASAAAPCWVGSPHVCGSRTLRAQVGRLGPRMCSEVKSALQDAAVLESAALECVRCGGGSRATHARGPGSVRRVCGDKPASLCMCVREPGGVDEVRRTKCDRARWLVVCFVSSFHNVCIASSVTALLRFWSVHLLVRG